MIQEAERFSDLVAGIYDAALDPASWPRALGGICAFVEGRAAGLVSKDAISKVGMAHHHFNVDAHYLRMYAETHFQFDPMATLPFFDVGQVVSTADLMPYDEFVKGRFYNEWARPQGFVDAANVVLEKSVTSCAYLSVIRDQAAGLVDDEMRRRMALVIPHVRRAALIGQAIDLRRYEVATFADALDGLTAGIYLVDAEGRIVHANASGHAILAAGDILHAVGSHLAVPDPQTDRALRDIFMMAGHGDAALGIKGIAIPLSSPPAELWLAHILPLTSGARRNAGIAYSAVAAVFVRKASLEAPSGIEIISKRYKLTPRELRVLATLGEGVGIPAAATALGVSEATVKTHLHQLFIKTGTNRQTELVKLIAAHASPLSR